MKQEMSVTFRFETNKMFAYEIIYSLLLRRVVTSCSAEPIIVAAASTPIDTTN